MISVITITLNNLEGLKRTVESVRCQTCTSLEYIIVDGASTDGTQEYLLELSRQKWWTESGHQLSIAKDSGIFNAMNKGVGMAHGQYCIFLNSGDAFCDSEVMKNASGFLGQCDIYSGHTRLVGKKITPHYAPHKLTLLFFIENSLSHPSTLIRTELLKKCPYNEELGVVSDWEFFLKQYMKGVCYKRMDFFVSDFYLDGISVNHPDWETKERQTVLKQELPDYIMRDYNQLEMLELKVGRAFAKTPLKRDYKILRNSLRALCKDLFIRK